VLPRQVESGGVSRKNDGGSIACSSISILRPCWEWHPLKGSLAGHWSVSVNGNWRLTFAFEGVDAVLVDYHDYH